MNTYENLKSQLLAEPKTWLITGVAGFIGSHLLESLLRLQQPVVGLDNYATGSRENLEQVKALVGPGAWQNFRQMDGDIRDLATCQQAAQGVDYILHQAALGSVPRSLAHPRDFHASNVTGFLNILLAARDGRIRRLVYASSSSVYGDHPQLPKLEDKIGRCLSPYAATKRANELYAEVFARAYGLETIGLRYFNVFGPRQDPSGAYAAVIPKWIASLMNHGPVEIYGDGETTRDFCYVANVVQANLLAATVQHPDSVNQIYNVAVCARTSLNQLYGLLRESLLPDHPYLQERQPVYGNFRAGDVRHSEADISKAARLLGYQPTHSLQQGLAEALGWYRKNL